MAPASAAERTYLYAASSLTGAMTALAAELETTSGHQLIAVFGASSTLARQILQGAPAHIFISAHPLWMDKIADKDLLEPGSRRLIANNRLVVAASRADAAALDLANTKALLQRLGNGRLAMADPNHVPAGIYGKQALQTLGLWGMLQDRLAIASNVRIALSYIERGETPLGIVYASDLVGRPQVTAVALFPDQSHAPISYPMAVLRGRSNAATKAFQQLLQSDKGRAILTRFGFQPL